MEAEAAERIWKRSLRLHNLRYTTSLSDGDAEDVLAVYPVKKEECINHVNKRMCTGLTNLKNSTQVKHVSTVEVG